ncbi:GTPase regulator Nrf1 [Elasticomyces elasticus]|nr:GTPase regulator Nrf1 [Elasticomyces elasticus]
MRRRNKAAICAGIKLEAAPAHAERMNAEPQERAWVANTLPGKRIALPVRVEPKVFFANERTFLSWLNFTVVLGGLAIGLLNFGDRVGQISAGLFTLVALASMLYALVTFHWRAKSIRMRGQGGFDDRFGPTVLAVALLAAVVVNFVLRITGAGGDHK